MTTPTTFRHWIGNLSLCNEAWKKACKDWKGKCNTVFLDKLFFYVENLEKSTNETIRINKAWLQGQYSRFSLFTVCSLKLSWAMNLQILNKYWTLWENTGLGSCEPLSMTVWSVNQYITLFYMCFSLKHPLKYILLIH